MGLNSSTYKNVSICPISDIFKIRVNFFRWGKIHQVGASETEKCVGS